MIAIENHFRINQTLLEKFQPDFDFIFSTGPCLKIFNRILIKKFQSDFEFYFSTTLCSKFSNRTLLKKFQPHLDFYFFIKPWLKKRSPDRKNPKKPAQQENGCCTRSRSSLVLSGAFMHQNPNGIDPFCLRLHLSVKNATGQTSAEPE